MRIDLVQEVKPDLCISLSDTETIRKAHLEVWDILIALCRGFEDLLPQVRIQKQLLCSVKMISAIRHCSMSELLHTANIMTTEMFAWLLACKHTNLTLGAKKACTSA